MKNTQKQKYNIWQNMLFMAKAAWKQKISFLLLCAISVGLNIGIDLLQLFITPEILKQVEQMVPIPKLLQTIILFSSSMLILFAGRKYVRDVSGFQTAEVRMSITNEMSRKCSITSFPNMRDPKLLKMVSAAQDCVSWHLGAIEHVWTTLIALATSVLGFLIYLLLLSELNITLAGVVIVTTVLSYFANKSANDWGYNHREEEDELGHRCWYFNHIARKREFAKDIRIFGLRPWITEIREASIKLSTSFIDRRARKYLGANMLDLVLTTARNGIAYFLLIQQALTNGLSAAEFLLYFSAIGNFAAQMNGILREFNTLQQESLVLTQVQESLNYPEPFRFSGGKPIPVSEQYTLELKNVSFRYPGTDKDIFKNLSLVIAPGEKLAVVGLNGAGKTTLILLLCGFYDPTEGRVLLNGIDIREFNRQEYYSLFSAVFQEFSILETTVRENVAQQALDIDDKRVIDCLQQAGLMDYINQLPQKLDTHVGRLVHLDGVLFSGGQIQRLMLARALYKDGPILILDEPTAALDPIAENDIYMKYNEMTANKTSLFISHRLASTRFCDRILFLANGRIEEEGTHDELLKLGGKYAELFEVQSRYYREGRDFREEAI